MRYNHLYRHETNTHTHTHTRTLSTHNCILIMPGFGTPHTSDTSTHNNAKSPTPKSSSSTYLPNAPYTAGSPRKTQSNPSQAKPTPRPIDSRQVCRHIKYLLRQGSETSWNEIVENSEFKI